MKRPTTLLDRVLLNEGLQVSLAVERDQKVISDRFEHEGMSFLTITLPSLCDALDQGLARGCIAPAMFEGFKPLKRGGKLPALLSGFFMRVFNLDGTLKVQPCIASIRAIRQVTRLFKKVELTCTSARISQAFERYVTNDARISEAEKDYPEDRLIDVISGYLWSGLEPLGDVLRDSPGGFGPGATAERSMRNERYNSTIWYERIEPFFPVSDFLVSRSDRRDLLEKVSILPEGSELPVRVVQVPKTLKSPRTISVEPSFMMLIQQSVSTFLYAVLESGYLGFNSIRFSDQTVNRDLARVGSIDGSLATIDLSDASDLVSNNLVKRILRTCPTILGYCQAARSSRARLPNGEVISLEKYASMGSALCFPIEAMVFLTLTVTAIVRQSGKRPSTGMVRNICKDIAVYGDDIIIPSETAAAVIHELEAFGLRVNKQKSFYTGLFRESCGGDYYGGHDVTPTYVRRWNDTAIKLSSSELASYVSLSNQFYMKGLWHAAQLIRDDLATRGFTRIPISTKECGVLTYSSVHQNTGLRWCAHTSGYRVHGYKFKVARRADPISDISGFIRLTLQPKAKVGYLRALRCALRYSKDDNMVGSNPAETFGRAFARYDGIADQVPSRDPNGSNEEVFGRYRSRSPIHMTEKSYEYDPLTSDRPHALKTKRGWAPVQTGLPGW